MNLRRIIGPFLWCDECARRLTLIRELKVRIKALEDDNKELKAKVGELSLLSPQAAVSVQPLVPVAAMAPEDGWAHLKASVKGFRKPFLQDAHEVVIDGENAVLLVCDGAGSMRNSKSGADFVVKHLGGKLRELLKSGDVLSKDIWPDLARKLFLEAAQDLNAKAQADRLPFDTFGCTCIVVFAGADFVACAHVGDGRAGYLDASGHWRALMTPHKGALANSTVFMTMLDAGSVSQLVRVNFVEGRTRAVVAMSDGPEDVCWQVSTFDPAGQKVVDPNQPSNEFLGKIANQLAGATAKKVTQDALDKLWQNFLTEGSPRLAAQVDDKTMLMALRG